MRSGVNILNTFVLAVLFIYVFAVITFLAVSGRPLSSRTTLMRQLPVCCICCFPSREHPNTETQP